MTDDPAQMAAAVVRLLGDDGTATGLATAGRRLVVERFGWDRIGADFVATVCAMAGLATRGT
jgi:glycosyltransferase involved in cell wall biosynthesis